MAKSHKLPAMGKVHVAETKVLIENDKDEVMPVHNIKFNNTNSATAWHVDMYMYFPEEKKEVLVFARDVPAGGMIEDDTTYLLHPGFKITAKATVSTITFLIN